jgi:hypothetical protein
MNLYEAEEAYKILEDKRWRKERFIEVCAHTTADIEEVKILNQQCLELAHKIRMAKESITDIEQLSKQGVSNNEVAVCPDPQHHAMELGLNRKCPTCGGETTFLEPDKCMTINCPNCIF